MVGDDEDEDGAAGEGVSGFGGLKAEIEERESTI